MKKLVIQGLGKWGEILVKSLTTSKIAKFTAAVSRDPQMINLISKKYKLKPYGSMEEALNHQKIDGLVLCTPHSVHAKQIMDYTKFNKPIFVEKPLALNVSDAINSVKKCKEKKIFLAVGQNRRFLSTYNYLKKMIDKNQLGKILHVEANFSGPSGFRHAKSGWRSNSKESPAGGMTGKGIHMTDLMISLLGLVKTVKARSKRQFLKNNMDDTTDVTLEFKNGSTGYLSTLTATADIWRFQVFGTKGWAEIRDEHNLKIKMNNKKEIIINTPKINTEKAELEAFVKSFNKNSFPVKNDQAIENIRLLENINLSVKKQKTIVVR